MKEDEAQRIQIEVRFVETSREDIENVERKAFGIINPDFDDFLLYAFVDAKDMKLRQVWQDRLRHVWQEEGIIDPGFILDALGMSWRADLLSSPFVTTKSGMQCTIKIGEDCIFPTALDVCPTTVTNDTSITYDIDIVPGNWATQHVGVALSVLPTWNPESGMIDLADLTAAVIWSPVWKTYPVSFTNDLGQTIPFQLPTFPAHIISTNFLSVHSGVTTLLETRTRMVNVKCEDKTPLWGDIPLLGRLFRYRYEAEEERVLLVFVTAKLVDPLPRPLGIPSPDEGEE